MNLSLPKRVARDVLIVSSNFPPLIGGSAVVYDQLCRNAPGRLMALGAARSYETGEAMPGSAENDARSPYLIHRLDYLRPPLSTKRRNRMLRLWSILVDDLPTMARTLAYVTVLTVRYRVKTVCLGELMYIGWLVFPVRYVLRRRVVIYTHGEEISQSTGSLLDNFRGVFLRHANVVISVSQFCKDCIVSTLGIPPERIVVISNGVALNIFSKGKAGREIFDSVVRDRCVILSVARLVERKGHEFLIRAMPAILKDIPNAHCVIIGTGPLAQGLKDLAAELELDGVVSFLGTVPVQSLVQFYRAADVFVLPCRTMPNGDTEGFGLVFLEANACGLPVVAGAAGGTVEAVIDGETGLIVDGTNSSDIAIATTRILRDSELAHRLAHRGWQRAQQLGWPRVARRFLDTCLDGSPRGPVSADLSVGPDADAGAAGIDASDSIAASILNPWFHVPAALPATAGPLLITTVDAEEDFDWTRPFSRSAGDVSSMAHQHLAHRIFERYRVVPTYLVDFPVASQPQGYGPMIDYVRDGKCEIGAQLHPWVNPPFLEEVSVPNSFAGNLPLSLEFEKLRILTETIEQGFGIRPRAYRAGRYGVGRRTGDVLKRLGYTVDTSVVPERNFADETGPNFFGFSPDPHWIDAERTMLELPISSAFVGPLSPGRRLAPLIFGARSNRRVVPALLSRSGLVERIKLTPEGIAVGDAKRLVRALLARGTRVFTLSYHTPSLLPGKTPYVRTAADLERLLEWLDTFYEFFFGEIRGQSATPRSVYDLAVNAKGHSD